jgi:hypothetical protein
MKNHVQVNVAFQQLIEEIESYEAGIGEEISQLAAKREWKEIETKTELARQVKQVVIDVENIQAIWEKLLSGEKVDRIESSSVPSTADELSAADRTTWDTFKDVTGNKIRVETSGGSSNYSNVIPLALLVDIALKALEIVEQKGYVKTSDVLKAMEQKIVSTSDYKKAPRLPVYVTFKVLTKGGVFTNVGENSHRYTLNGDREVFLKYLDNLDVVTYNEALLRLRAAGLQAAEQALTSWANTEKSKGGFDGSLSGEKNGELYKLLGSEPRRVVWPYRYE